MPCGTTLANAYVQILPTTKGIKGNLESELGGAGTAILKAEIAVWYNTGRHKREKTPDYLIGDDEKRWDHKGLHGAGGNALRKRILGHEGRGKEQAENYLIDIADWKGSDENIIEQARKIFSWFNTDFVDEVMIIREGQIVKAFKKA